MCLSVCLYVIFWTFTEDCSLQSCLISCMKLYIHEGRYIHLFLFRLYAFLVLLIRVLWFLHEALSLKDFFWKLRLNPTFQRFCNFIPHLSFLIWFISVIKFGAIQKGCRLWRGGRGSAQKRKKAYKGEGLVKLYRHKLFEKNYYWIILMIPYVIKELSNLMSVIIKVEIFNKMINLPNLQSPTYHQLITIP